MICGTPFPDAGRCRLTRFLADRRYWSIPLLFWLVLAGSSLAWNWADIESHHEELLTNRARFIFKMVESVRLWNARHGGLYALVDERTPPNPHLEVEERDIQTPSGRPLTLINPAYMTRQLSAVVDEIAGVRIHITSRNPLNPDNAASPWEAAALSRFEAQPETREWSSFSAEDEGDARQFRYIAPLYTKQACLQCHEKQGYKLGELRGGIGVTFPPEPMLTTVSHQYRNLVIIHAVALLLLWGLTLLFLNRLRQQFLDLKQAHAQQEQKVHERTRELDHEMRQHRQAEERLQRFIQASGEGIIVVDAQGRFTLSNPAALRILGYGNSAQLLGRPLHALLCSREQGGESPCDGCPIAPGYIEGKSLHIDELKLRREDGSLAVVELQTRPVYEDEVLSGAVITFDDISERIERDRQLRKLSSALEYSPVAAFITDTDGRIEYVNRRFVEQSGYAQDELLGNTPALLKSGQTLASTYHEMWSRLNRGEPWSGELLNRRKGGELIWEETAIAPIANDEGEVINFVAFKENITRRKAEQEAIWRQANHDPLTGLANRHLFEHQLEQRISEAARYGHRFALMFMDMDGFKRVNDTLGHDAGDDLLRHCAERLERNTRGSDLVARLGGDEFVIIMPEFRRCIEVIHVAKKLVHSLSQPFTLKGEQVKVSASMGVAVYPNDALEPGKLLNHADAAMYRAKRHGKNRVEFFAEHCHEQDAAGNE